MANEFGFDRLARNAEAALRNVNVLLSNQAQNYFVDSFEKQGWNGRKWKEVDRRREGTNAYKYPKARSRTNPILVASGDLRRQVSVMARTAQISPSQMRMVLDVPYAERHNEGLKGMPKRQFIGQTPELTRMQSAKIKEIIDNIWQR